MAAAALYAVQPADRSARSGAARSATGGSRQEDAKRARGSNNAAGKSGNKPYAHKLEEYIAVGVYAKYHNEQACAA